jgi:chromosome partitioning protein
MQGRHENFNTKGEAKAMKENQTRIIAVANEKGGVGKTATVINLGAALSKEKKTVLIVDMDPQAAATRGFGIDPGLEAPSVYEMISDPENHPFQDVVQKTRWKGIHVLPASADLSGAEVELVEVEGRENRLKEALESVNGSYDFILVDTPPSLSLLTVNVFSYAGEVLVPCQTQPYAYAALDELFDTISAVKEAINPDLAISGIVATFYDPRTRVSRDIMELLKTEEKTRDLLLHSVIRTNTTVAESAHAKKPVVFYRRGSRGTRDYMALAREVLDQNA